LSTTTKVLVTVLGVVGIAAIVVGYMYFSLQVRQLPHWFPYYNAHHHFRRRNRGAAGIVLGILLLVGAVAVALVGRRRSAELT
jgi:drug/metabolite transporter (DMT)-like permease